MTPKQLLERARAIALEAHAGQVEKNGRPYFEHAERVAKRFSPEQNPELAAIGYLHDVLEDCPAWTAERLRGEGFPVEIVDAVVALTKIKGEDPADAYPTVYAARVRANRLAYTVKISDLLDNCDLSRIPLEEIGVRDLRRLRNYLKMLSNLFAQVYGDFGEMIESIARSHVTAVLVGRPDEVEVRVDVEGLGPLDKGRLN